MRPISSFLALSATIALGTSASDASIFTFDSDTELQGLKAPAISDASAQRLLELRMGSPTSSILGSIDQQTVELLNRYGGSQLPLFDLSSGNEDIKRSLLILEGVGTGIESSLQHEYQRDLVISHPFTTFLHDSSFNTLIETDVESCTVDRDADLQTARSCIPNMSPFDAVSRAFENELSQYTDMVESWVDERRSKAALRVSFKSTRQSGDSAVIASSLKSLFRDLNALQLKDQVITVVLMPGSQGSQIRNQSLNRRNAGREEALSKPINPAHSSLYEQQATTLSRAPICHTSNSSCTEATNNCSGHGFCYKKSGSTDQSSTCYACKCQETTIRKEDGTVQKIRWGGPACQKKDISSPFFLIAGISVLVVVAVSLAIGMLFNIGQGELPGVISAGVGAPRAQK